MVAKKKGLFRITIIPIKIKEPKVKEMSFAGNRKNRLDTKLEKSFKKQEKKK